MANLYIRVQAQPIDVLQAALGTTSFPAVDCNALRNAVLSARQGRSKKINQLPQRLLTSDSIPRNLRHRDSEKDLLVIPTSDQGFRRASDYLPASTYAPESDDE